MKEYIDKDALIAEIDNRIKKYILLQQKPEMSVLEKELWGTIDCLNSIKGYILNTLEVKEVDLDKEIDRYYNIEAPKEFEDALYEDIEKFAKHFFELGFKVKQESNDDVKIGETQIYLEDDGGEPPYDGKQWLDLSCTEYEIPKTIFKDGDNVEVLIRKVQKGE